MMGEPSFLKASPSDLEDFFKIELECFDVEAFSKQRYLELLNDPAAISIKAIVKAQTIGFAIATLERSQQGPLGTVQTLNVRPPFRRIGVGHDLMSRLETEMRQRGCYKIILQTRVGNSPAINLFTKMGYMRTRLLRNYYDAGISAYEMTKTLDKTIDTLQQPEKGHAKNQPDTTNPSP